MKTLTPGNFNIKWIGSNFKEHFGESKVKPKKFTPKGVVLSKAMLDSEILDTYKPEEITPDEIAFLLKSKDGLLTNGYANIFYVRDKKGILWAVGAHWLAGLGGWYVRALSVDRPVRWDAGNQVVSRNLTLSPSDTPSLESFISELKTLIKKYEN